MHMGIEKFQEVIDALHPTLIGISMSLRGEPLMGKHVTEMIAYAHAKNIAVSFPTNLSLPLTETRIKDLIESGLDAMYVALDGASHETYGRYRVGGNFNLVVNNVKAIARMKKALGKHNPTLIWKFVVFDHNRHELETVKQTYKDMGFDTYEIAHNYNGEKRKSHVGQMKQSMVERKQGCYWAWHTTIIRADGEVHPCCKKMHHDFGLGNINENDLLDIWRNDAYAKLRQGFTTMNPEMLHPSCAQCLGLTAPTQPTVPLVRVPVEIPS
jgi:radical SAM protein with 4Fe4S-binding SPASM domain